MLWVLYVVPGINHCSAVCTSGAFTRVPSFLAPDSAMGLLCAVLSIKLVVESALSQDMDSVNPSLLGTETGLNKHLLDE